MSDICLGLYCILGCDCLWCRSGCFEIVSGVNLGFVGLGCWIRVLVVLVRN